MVPIYASLYFRFKEQFIGADEAVQLSKPYTYASPMRILAKTRIGRDQMLRVFHLFDNDVYYAILLLIVLITCVIGVNKWSLRAFFNTFWAYLSALLSEYHSYPDKTIFERWMSCPWLIGCVIFEAAFTGMLRDQILKGEDIHWTYIGHTLDIQWTYTHWIDSLGDLYEWKHITKLQYTDFSDFNKYLIRNDTMKGYISTPR